MDVSGQLHVPAALPPGKEPRYPLDRRLNGPQSRSRSYLNIDHMNVFFEILNIILKKERACGR